MMPDDRPNVFASIPILSPNFPSIFGPRLGNVVLFPNTVYLLPYCTRCLSESICMGACGPSPQGCVFHFSDDLSVPTR